MTGTTSDQFIELVIIQPTPFCNINCSYCYLPNRLVKKQISFDTLGRIAESVLASSRVKNALRILWHAGEPLTVPVAFYEEAFAIIARFNTRNVKIEHAFQTNGTLIDQAWCDLIKKHDVQIGISIDGPRDLHDSTRIDRRGKGTFDRTMRGAEILRQNAIAFSVLTVITRPTLARADDLWQFFNNNNVSRVGFNIEEIIGDNLQTSLQEDRVSDLTRDFFRRLLDLTNGKPQMFRELHQMLAYIQYGANPIHTLAARG